MVWLYGVTRLSDLEVCAAERAVPFFYIRCVRTSHGQRRQTNSEEWTRLCCGAAVSLKPQ